ncbi:hypothetical protein [Lacihabitans lacunae]|uniref:Uncharacterized protein n=1 Tax=Lacihabitans lacunae TaxID=1028214 RepID=A0ABV7YSU9_9BACT
MEKNDLRDKIEKLKQDKKLRKNICAEFENLKSEINTHFEKFQKKIERK